MPRRGDGPLSAYRKETKAHRREWCRPLFPVHVVAFGQGVDGLATDVLFADAAHQVVEEALSKGAVGRAHAFDSQRFERRHEYDQPAGEDAAPRPAQSVEAQLAGGAGLDDGVSEPPETPGGDPVAAPAGVPDHGLDGADGARSSQGLFPTEIPVACLD